jgi:SAM-dependent methyltransferase
MVSRLFPYVYERLWRPVGIRIAMRRERMSPREERRLAIEMLGVSSGDRVLDMGCGPGTLAREIAQRTDAGLVVGVDASRPMLAAAARRTRDGSVAYVRADAGALPFRAENFDAVCCFAVLHLIEHPQRALDEMVRVLAPGGRLALLTGCRPKQTAAPERHRAGDPPKRALGGVHLFAPEEIPDGLRERGLCSVEQRVHGMAQFVSARKPA